ncbi:MAG: hypothetical protein ACR2KT_15705 [Methylocella sp.]
MIVQVHAGEMIVPSGPAQALRDLAGGAGVGNTIHLHVTHAPVINAVDGASVRRLYEGSEKQLLRQLQEAVRKGAHLGFSELSTG